MGLTHSAKSSLPHLGLSVKTSILTDCNRLFHTLLIASKKIQNKTVQTGFHNKENLLVHIIEKVQSLGAPFLCNSLSPAHLCVYKVVAIQHGYVLPCSYPANKEDISSLNH